MFLDIEEKDFIWNRVFDKNDFSGKRMEDRMKENKKVELLAPAGSYESMVAAINAGAEFEKLLIPLTSSLHIALLKSSVCWHESLNPQNSIKKSNRLCSSSS